MKFPSFSIRQKYPVSDVVENGLEPPLGFSQCLDRPVTLLFGMLDGVSDRPVVETVQELNRSR